MPRYVLKLKGQKKTKYMIWSTIVDAPIIYDMEASDVREWWEKEYGRQGMQGFDEMMKKVEETGSSVGRSPKEIVSFNRAGKNEKHMPYKDIIAVYVDQTVPEPA